MFQVFRNAWMDTQLRKKILYTLFIIVLFRLGSNIFVPFLDNSAISTMMGGASLLNYLDVMTGGSLVDHALYQCVDHYPASCCRYPSSGKAPERGRGRQKETQYDHQVYVACAGYTSGYCVLLHAEKRLQRFQRSSHRDPQVRRCP